MEEKIKKLKIGEFYIFTDNRRKFYKDIRILKTEWGYILTLVGIVHSLKSYRKRCCYSIEQVKYKIEKMII